MTDPSSNTVWARALLDELARCGLRDVIVAPGSRSTSLVLAAESDPRLRVRVHLDERSAAYFALGLGKIGRPAVVLTTSGTAVANLLPAIVEASQASVPLLVVTADRPPRLRGADANQAIDQHGIFGRYPRAFFELAAASLDGRALGHLRAVACRAWSHATGGDRGPVHLNVPLDKPLEPYEPPPTAVEGASLAISGRPDGAPWTSITRGVSVPTDEDSRRLFDTLSGERPVVVVGPVPDRASGRAALDAARRFGCPLLADPLSAARFGPGALGVSVAGYDLFLRDDTLRRRLEPTGIVRIGRSPVSAALQRWLFEHAEVPQIVLDDGERYKDHGATALHYVVADPSAALDAVAEPVGPDPREAWRQLWRAADEAARAATATIPIDCEGAILRAVIAAVPDEGTLFVSNSMPIRDLDAFGLPTNKRVRVLANRGASGIDGVVSTAFGVAAGAGPAVCVLGDLAFFHDSNGLLWSREDDAPVVFVLIDNDGGGIFHMLPISEHEPAFTNYFATPHGLDFRHAAALHRVAYEALEVTALAPAMQAALDSGRSRILHVRTDRDVTHRRRQEIADEVIRSVRGAVPS